LSYSSFRKDFQHFIYRANLGELLGEFFVLLQKDLMKGNGANTQSHYPHWKIDRLCFFFWTRAGSW